MTDKPITYPVNQNTLVKITNPTEADIYQAVGDNVIERWRVLGNTIDGAQRALGNEARALIEHFDELPAYKMAVYKAIGKAAGKSAESIRKYYYAVKRIKPSLWEKYELVSFSAFGHAAKFDRQEEILAYALEHACSIEELRAVFPLAGDVEAESIVTQNQYPPYFRRIVSEARLYGVLAEVEPRLMEIQKIIQQAKNGNQE